MGKNGAKAKAQWNHRQVKNKRKELPEKAYKNEAGNCKENVKKKIMNKRRERKRIHEQSKERRIMCDGK